MSLRNIDIISADLHIDEGSPYWQISVVVANEGDFESFQPNDTFVFNLFGEEYHFYVDQKSLDRNAPGALSMTIHGIGLSAALDLPRQTPLTKTWDEAQNAKSIVEELLGATLVDWGLKDTAGAELDWPIEKDRLSVENGSKLKTAMEVVAAAGGLIEGNPDGTLYVRHHYPISPVKYSTAVADHVYEELTNVLTVNHSYENSRYVDWVRIRNLEETGTQDSLEMEWDEGSQLEGTMRGFPIPWRDVSIIHTANSAIISMGAQTTRTWKEEELIEIYDGKGSVNYPIISINSIDWQETDLQGLYYEPYTRDVYSTSSLQKYSLVRIVYTTKAVTRRVSSDRDYDAQFLLEDLGAT